MSERKMYNEPNNNGMANIHFEKHNNNFAPNVNPFTFVA